MSFVWATLLIIALLVCWAVTWLGLPGNWLMLLVAAVYAWVGPSDSRLGMGTLPVIGLFFLAASGEVLEMGAAAVGTKKVGGSKRSAVLALIGSLAGGIVGVTVGLPIPFVGVVVAALLFAGLGAMIGAMLGESWKGEDMDKSWNVGKAAFWGRMAGTLAKAGVGLLMIFVTLASLAL